MNRGQLRDGFRRTATLVAAVVVLVLGAAPAQAHSELERSDPPNGGMVPPGRDFLTLWFGEPISGSASTFVLHGEDGTGVTSRVSSVDGGRTVVHIDTPALERGIYELEWRIVSLDDGHPSSGTLVFGVGRRPAVISTDARALPGASLVAARWLDLSAIMLAIGALAVSGRVLGALGKAGRTPRRRARLVAAVAAAAAVYTGLLTPFLRTQRPGNPLGVWSSETWATLTGTPWGHAWLAREAAAVLAAAAVWSWARSRGTATGRARIAAAALALVAVLDAAAGHAADLPSGSVAAVLASAAHLAAAGVWAGGLVTLVLCLVPSMRRDPDLRGPAMSTVWRRYSPLAAVASVVLLATGLYLAGVHVPTLGFIGSTVYGEAVAAKTVLVAVALSLAALNTLLVHPGLAGRLARRPGWSPLPLRRFPSIVTAEAAVLLVAVAAAAVMTSAPTARVVEAATRTTAPHHEDVNGLFITFEDLPSGPGRSTLVARIRPTVLPEPAPVGEVRVALEGPAGTRRALPLAPVEPGRYETQTARLVPGTWTATVTVVRPGLPDTVSRAQWRVADPTSGRTRPFRTATTGLAGLLLVLLAAVLLHSRRRRPTPRTTSGEEGPVHRVPEPERSPR